jgi:hypothetical protein
LWQLFWTACAPKNNHFVFVLGFGVRELELCWSVGGPTHLFFSGWGCVVRPLETNGLFESEKRAVFVGSGFLLRPVFGSWALRSCNCDFMCICIMCMIKGLRRVGLTYQETLRWKRRLEEARCDEQQFFWKFVADLHSDNNSEVKRGNGTQSSNSL